MRAAGSADVRCRCGAGAAHPSSNSARHAVLGVQHRRSSKHGKYRKCRKPLHEANASTRWIASCHCRFDSS